MERSKLRTVMASRWWHGVRAVLAGLLFLTATAGVARGEEARIELNTASAADLETLPGVGPAKAQAIIAHREASPFKSADELVDVKGIGEKLYAQLKDKVTVAAPAAGAGGAGDKTAPAAAAQADAKGGRTASASGAR